MYGTYNSDILKRSKPVLIIVTVLIIETIKYLKLKFHNCHHASVGNHELDHVEGDDPSGEEPFNPIWWNR